MKILGLPYWSQYVRRLVFWFLFSLAIGIVRYVWQGLNRPLLTILIPWVGVSLLLAAFLALLGPTNPNPSGSSNR